MPFRLSPAYRATRCTLPAHAAEPAWDRTADSAASGTRFAPGCRVRPPPTSFRLPGGRETAAARASLWFEGEDSVATAAAGIQPARERRPAWSYSESFSSAGPVGSSPLPCRLYCRDSGRRKASPEDGAPGETRTPDLRIRSSLISTENKENKPLSSADHGKIRQNPQPIRNQSPDKNNPKGGES